MEIWKPITFNTAYEVSSFGNFRNAKTKRQTVFHIEKLKLTQTRIRVNVKNTIKSGSGFYLHRLIAMTFLPNPQNLKEVNHIDGNPYNNCVDNLEWITREDNMRHFHEGFSRLRKPIKQVVLCCAVNHTIISTFLNIQDCLTRLQLPVSYTTIYTALNAQTIENENRGSYRNNYVGVRFNEKNRKYVATYKNKYIGSFEHEIQAAKAYDAHIRMLLDVYPKITNFPENGEVKAIVGKKRYKDGGEAATYPLHNQNQYLRYADDINDCVSEPEWREISEAPKYLVSDTGLVKHARLNRILQGYNRNGYLQVTIKTNDNTNIARLVHRLVATAFIENCDPVNKIYVDHIDTNPKNNYVSNLQWVTPKENMNNEITKANISKGHRMKPPKSICQIDILTGNQVTPIGSGVISRLNNVRVYENKWIFVYENELEHLPFMLEKCAEKKPNAGIKKQIAQIDGKTGDIIASYPSLREASKALTINYTAISQVCNYYKYEDAERPVVCKLKSANGFVFKFL